MIKLGIVGLSEGNGHPYSWSAIFNGYQPEMANNDFPVIFNYLEERNMPAETIKGASVTHVWTQDFSLSRDIAKAANIPRPVEYLEELLDAVDMILFARDDCHERQDLLLKAIDSGKPIFIDKPIELSGERLAVLKQVEKYPNQIFSCSSLRYSHQIKKVLKSVGSVNLINAYIPKSWAKYSVHLIDPVVFHFLSDAHMTSASVIKTGETVQVSSTWDNSVVFNCTTLGNKRVVPKIEVLGDDGTGTVLLDDSFGIFKASLESFIDFATTKNPTFEKDSWPHHEKVVSLIEKGIGHD